eukprot:378409-Pyramimonas_sp.AAC.1
MNDLQRTPCHNKPPGLVIMSAVTAPPKPTGVNMSSLGENMTSKEQTLLPFSRNWLDRAPAPA